MISTAWEELYQVTNSLTKINKVTGLITKEKIARYHQLIKEVLIEFISTKELHQGLKTYIGKTLRNDLSENLKQIPCLPDESLQDWTKRVFGKEKFGMVLNYLESFSDEFTRTAASDVEPLLKIAGLPLGGLSFLFFMGDYGFTPFGIHKEASGEEGFLFHLGPGVKKFYAWDDPQYNRIEHNTAVFHNIEDWLPKATCYTLAPGDAMFIPHNVYHVADTQEFSISFVMDYINPSRHQLAQDLLRSLGKEQKVPKNLTYHTPVSFGASDNDLQGVLQQKTIQQRMEDALQNHVLNLKSNGGILRKATLNRNISFGENTSFSRVAPFKMYWQIAEESIKIYARGHQITVDNHPQLPTLLEHWNNDKKRTLNDLQTIFSPLWDLMTIYGLLNQLLQYNVLLVEKNKA